jgi:hypothetical protein
MAKPASTTYMDEIAASIHAQRHAGQRLNPRLRELYLGYAVLALVLGESVDLEDVHNAWAAWAAVHDPGNAALRPFAELPQEVQARDAPFCDAIRRVARVLPADTTVRRARRPR